VTGERASAPADIFIVGPARSGTSWLQTMLAEHPAIASPPETELFSAYLVPMARSWQRHRGLVRAARREAGDQMAYGLATVLTDEEFVGLIRSFYASVRDTVLAAKPGATRFLEKTPDHALYLDTIKQVAPDAQFLFLVRDPRDTVRSLLEASREPWGHWAPKSVADATDLWLRNVRAALDESDDPRMLTVRYEDLRSGSGELERIAAFLHLGRPSEWMQTPVEASPGERVSMVVGGEATGLTSNPYEAAAFSFHDRRERRPLTAYEQAYVVSRCHKEMEALGYPTDSGPLSPRVRVEGAAHALWATGRAFGSRITKRVALHK